jgi:signal transduction histidine kinase
VLATPIAEGDAAILVVTTELDPLEEFRPAYLAVALPLTVMAVVFAGLAGWLLSRRALRPVAKMTRDADEIGETSLHQRLVVPRARDELGRLAATLSSMLDRLERAVRRERDFTADASHEPRTPLAILRTELELTLNRTDDPAVRASLRSALEERQRLEGLTDDLLLIARAEADQHGGRVPVDLGDLSDRVLARFRTVAKPVTYRSALSTRLLKARSRARGSPDTTASPLRVSVTLRCCSSVREPDSDA